MKVSELKRVIASMDDNQEIDASVPLKYIISAEDICKKRLYLKVNCPDGGIPLDTILDKDEWAEALDGNTDGDITAAVLNILDEDDILGDILRKYVVCKVK